VKKEEISARFDALASERDRWRKKNRYYHREVRRLLKFLIPEGACVLDMGSSTGDLLNRLKPSKGVGIDLSPQMVERASKNYPHLRFRVQDAEEMDNEESFDFVVMSGCIGLFRDIWKVFRGLRKVTSFESRVVIVYYNRLWEPVLELAQKIGLRMPRPYQNWLGLNDIHDLLHLNGFEVIKQGKKVLLPVFVPVLSWLFNEVLARLPVLSRLCLVEYLVARKVPLEEEPLRCSVVVPCRNEAGNIGPLLERLPVIGVRPEVIFVDGYSTDGTVEKIEELVPRFKNKFEIRLIHQIPGRELRRPAIFQTPERCWAWAKATLSGKGSMPRTAMS